MKQIERLVCFAVYAGSCSVVLFGQYDLPSGPEADGVAVMTESDVGSHSSITMSGHWNPEGIPSSTYDYWVPAGMTIVWPSVNTTFAGKSLTLGGSVNGSGVVVTFDPLRMLGGASISQHAIGAMIAGTLVVEGTQANPATFQFGRVAEIINTSFLDGGKMVGPGTAWFEIQHVSRGALRNRIYLGDTDMSSYFGTLRLLRTEKSLDGTGEGYFTNIVQNGALDFPGTLAVGPGAELLFRQNNAACTLAVANLILEKGCVLTPLDGRITVTNRLSIASGATINAGPFSAASGHTVAFQSYNSEDEVLFALKDVAADPENLPDLNTLTFTNLTFAGYNYWGANPLGYTTASTEPLQVNLAWRRGRPINKLQVATADAEGARLDSDAVWSLGHVPTSAENAVCPKGYLFTVYPSLGDYVFPAGGLVLVDNTMTVSTKRFSVSNLFVTGYDSNGIKVTTDGALTDYADWPDMENATIVHADYFGCYATKKVMLEAGWGRGLILDAPIHGSGVIIATTQVGTSMPNGSIEFTGINTNYTGPLTICSDNAQSATNSVTGKRLQFWVNDARNLGGAMAADTFNAITLRGDSLVIGRQSLDFNQTNRGLYVQDRIRFVMRDADSNTLAFRVPITYGGELVFGNDYPDASMAKVGKGDGTLVIDAPARFYDAVNKTVCATPVVGKNLLTLLVGRLRVTDADGVDGVAVTFGAETGGLEIDVTSEISTGQTGFLSVKDGSSLTATSGTIPVTFLKLPADGSPVRNIAVCTVPLAHAAATCAAFVSPEVANGKVMFRTVANNDGTTATIYADIDKFGFVLTLR